MEKGVLLIAFALKMERSGFGFVPTEKKMKEELEETAELAGMKEQMEL